MEMLTEYRTNTKVITYPMFPIERSLEKKYRGIAYPKKQTTHISYRLGRYRGIEHEVTVKS